MGENVFEVEGDNGTKTCATECESKHFTIEKGRNKCIKSVNNETCKFYLSNATKNMTQCF